MTESEHLALIYAEMDGELDGRQRAELARQLLADPEFRELRDDIQRLCAMLDAVDEVEPPVQLRTRILDALPPPAPSLNRTRWSVPRWRFAALVAGVLVAAAVVLETIDGTGPASTEVAGTIAAPGPRVTLDSVHIRNGSVSGQVSLYRDDRGASLVFDLASSAPVDVLIASGGHTQRVDHVVPGGTSAEPGATVPLRGFGTGEPQAVDLTFFVAGREVGRATLSAPGGH
jgi:hypothetical protein